LHTDLAAIAKACPILAEHIKQAINGNRQIDFEDKSIPGRDGC
jgi:hypothetical protein